MGTNIEGIIHPFVILGLPRSRTAWLANFFTYGRLVTCEHDALSKVRSRSELQAIFARAPIAGIADGTAALIWDQLCDDIGMIPRTLIVKRDMLEVQAALEDLQVHIDRQTLGDMQVSHEWVAGETESMVVEAKMLGDVGTMHRVWEWITRKRVPWDVERWEMLRGFNVQIQEWKAGKARKVRVGV